MSKPPIRPGIKYFLHGLSSVLAVIAGISFLFGGGLIHAVGSVDRLFAEILGIGIAFACLIGIVVAKYVIDDIEWREANEEAAASDSQGKP